MRAPRTYTREDVVEIQAHGGPLVLRRILEAGAGGGRAAAQPGEMTLRAFLNGRVDLAQAEAVMALINAEIRRGPPAGAQAASGRAFRRGRRGAQARDGRDGAHRGQHRLPRRRGAAARSGGTGGTDRRRAADIERLLAGADRGRRATRGAARGAGWTPECGQIEPAQRAAAAPSAPSSHRLLERPATRWKRRR